MFLIFYLLLLNQTFKDIRQVVMECNQEVMQWVCRGVPCTSDSDFQNVTVF